MIWMSRISKRKLMKALKGDLEMPVNRKTLLDQLAKPVTQEEWLRGYREWRRKQLADD
jgi:hypothetical protein